jgi:hypothetical protein
MIFESLLFDCLSRLGEQIAKIQLFLILVSLFQKFHFQFAHNWTPTSLRGQPGITLRPPSCQYQASVR